MKNLTWQNPEQLFVAQELINKVKSKCCGIKAKIERLAAYLTANPQAKVVICGYADKATGTPKINDALSLKRAQAVSKALQVKKIDAGRIRVEHKGDTVQPFTEVEKNRVSICIAE